MKLPEAKVIYNSKQGEGEGEGEEASQTHGGGGCKVGRGRDACLTGVRPAEAIMVAILRHVGTVTHSVL